jgi:ABC-2 type transport system permease protein
MRKITAIILKDILVRFSGAAEWLFFLILPVIFTVILAGGTGSDSSDARVRLVVVDQARTPLSAQLLAELEQSQSVRPEVLPPDQADQEFSSRRVSAVLVIPASFDLAHLAQASGPALELRQQPNNLNALAASRAVSAAAERTASAVDIANSSVAEAERIRPFASAAARTAYFEAALQAAQTQLGQSPNRVLVTQGATPDPVQYNPRANSSAGQLITWVFVPLIGISGLFAYERQQGTLRRLLTTPTRKATYLLGTIAGQVVMALVQMLLLIGFGILVMKLDWGEAPLALAVVLISAALAGAALGTTLGTFVKTEGQASGLSIMLGMVMALLGGCWYPIELFPAFVQTAVRVLPTTWAMQGLLDIVVRHQDLAAVLPTAGVLLGFAALFFAVGVARFRYE